MEICFKLCLNGNGLNIFQYVDYLDLLMTVDGQILQCSNLKRELKDYIAFSLSGLCSFLETWRSDWGKISKNSRIVQETSRI